MHLIKSVGIGSISTLLSLKSPGIYEVFHGKLKFEKQCFNDDNINDNINCTINYNPYMIQRAAP
jgi:hypothetical protein